MKATTSIKIQNFQQVVWKCFSIGKFPENNLYTKVNGQWNFTGTGYPVHCSFLVPATTKIGSLVAIFPAYMSLAGRGQLRAEKV